MLIWGARGSRTFLVDEQHVHVLQIRGERQLGSVQHGLDRLLNGQACAKSKFG